MLKGLFKAGDGVACFSLAYLTGILPIKKYNSQSALNNFDEYNMLHPDTFAPYFGFTDEEVREICRLPRCPISQEQLKEWYEGYRFAVNDADDNANKADGNSNDNRGKYRLIDVYNPNSVCKAVSRNRCSQLLEQHVVK